LMAALFERFDLLIVDPSHRTVKRRSAPLIARELERTDEHGEALASQTRRVEAAGYEAQVPVLPGATNVFYEDERGRERVMRSAEGWLLRRTRRTMSRGELRHMLEERPERFSPNVFLRPVVEAAVFPTVAYVAGPGEMAYYAQLGCLYEEHGIGMPPVHPRASFVLVEPKVREVLDKFELEPEALRAPLHEIAARVLRERMPAEVRDALGRWRRSLDETAERLEQTAMPIDPTLRGPIQGARNAMHIELNGLEKRIVRRIKDRDRVTLRQLEKARVNLFPDSSPQERVINVLQYLARYGVPLLDELAASIETDVRSVAPAWAGRGCA
ncbi:MAG: bacillithiol biosynthesis cysteine-adding enzyme BshC, partial [Gemmatimonadota bacterium]